MGWKNKDSKGKKIKKVESKRRVGERRKEKRIGKARKESREEKKKWTQSGTLELYLIILMSSLMLTWSGTRNLVLSRMGSCFSPLYLSMITYRQRHKQNQSLHFYSDWWNSVKATFPVLFLDLIPWQQSSGHDQYWDVIGGWGHGYLYMEEKRTQSSACESKVHVYWSKANLPDLQTQTVFLTAVRHLIKLKNAFQISLLQTALQKHTDGL